MLNHILFEQIYISPTTELINMYLLSAYLLHYYEYDICEYELMKHKSSSLNTIWSKLDTELDTNQLKLFYTNVCSPASKTAVQRWLTPIWNAKRSSQIA